VEGVFAEVHQEKYNWEMRYFEKGMYGAFCVKSHKGGRERRDETQHNVAGGGRGDCRDTPHGQRDGLGSHHRLFA
jgi:hypothetical protein